MNGQVFIERLWRSVETRKMSPQGLRGGSDASIASATYFASDDDNDPSVGSVTHAIGDLSRARLKARAAAGRKRIEIAQENNSWFAHQKI